MADSDSSVTTLGESNRPEKRSAAGDKVGLMQGDTTDSDECQSVDHLLTQDEGSGDEEEEEDNDCFFGITKAKSSEDGSNDSTWKSPETKHNKAVNDTTYTPIPERRPAGRDGCPRSPPTLSPATRTLDNLSQQSSQDLRYDMSQLESDTANVLIRMHAAPSPDFHSRGKPTERINEEKMSFNANSKNSITKKDTMEKVSSMKIAATPQVAKEKQALRSKQAKESTKECMTPEFKARRQERNSSSVVQHKYNLDHQPQQRHKLVQQQSATRGDESNSPATPSSKADGRKEQPKDQNAKSTQKQSSSRQQVSMMWKDPQPNSTQQSHPTRQQKRPSNCHPPPQPMHSTQQQQAIQKLQPRGDPNTVDLTNYRVLHMVVPEPGTLGVTIAKAHPPAEMAAYPKLQFGRVKLVTLGTSGDRAGFKSNDWFLQDSSSGRLRDYDSLLCYARSKERPLQFCVARRKRIPTEAPQTSAAEPPAPSHSASSNAETYHQEKAARLEETTLGNPDTGSSPPNSNPTTEARSRPTQAQLKASEVQTPCESVVSARSAEKKAEKARKEKRRTDAMLDADSSASEEDDPERIVLPYGNKLVPFCKLCNLPKIKKTTKRAVHHALCPENDCFEESSADNILKNIVEGVRRGCEPCREAYRSGKAPKKSVFHNFFCPNRNASSLTEKQGTNSKPPKSKVIKKNIDPKKNIEPKGPKQKAASACNKKGMFGSESKAQTKETPASRALQKKVKKGRPTGGKAGGTQQAGRKATRKDQSSSRVSTPEGPEQQAGNTSVDIPSGSMVDTGRLPGKHSEQTFPPQESCISRNKNSPTIDQNKSRNRPFFTPQPVAALVPRARPAEQSIHVSSGTQAVPTADQRQSSLASQTKLPPVNHGNSHFVTPSTTRTGNSRSQEHFVSLQPGHDNMHIPGEQEYSPPTTMAASSSCAAFSEALLTEPPRIEDDLNGKSKWLVCEDDPWGPDGHIEGDVVVLTLARGLGHYETEFPSSRYRENPFSEPGSYHKTHATPSEGFHLIRLERDAMAKRSWGFTVQLHDFGDACLIDSIDPSSPAAAAVFVGGKPSLGGASALRINDMIIAVNGKDVGGMSEVGMEVEMETCGLTLSLVVARYRFADQLKKTLTEAEENVMSAMNEALNDDRALDWVEAGSTRASISTSSIAARAIDEQLQGGESHGSPKDLDQKIVELPAESTNLNGRMQIPGHDNGQAGSSMEPPLETEEEIQQSDTNSPRRIDQDEHRGPNIATGIDEPIRGQKDSTAVCWPSPDVPVRASVTSDPPHQAARTGDLSGSSRRLQREVHSKGGSLAVNAQNEAIDVQSIFVDASVETNPTIEMQSPAKLQEGGLFIVDADVDTKLALECHTRIHQESQEDMDDFGHQADDECGVEGGREDGDAEDTDNDSSEEASDDGNPACGCVCGKIHGQQWVVFWIQCGTCEAWYSAARKCLGFTEAEAKSKQWSCWACSPSDDGDDDEEESAEEEATRKNSRPLSDIESDNDYFVPAQRYIPRKRRKTVEEDPEERICDPNVFFPEEDFVRVHREGSHMYGGDGQVVKTYLDEDGERRYDVRYVINRYTENYIHQKYVSAFE